MATGTFLVFGMHSSLFAIDALKVREILWLPELALIEEEPEFISGVFNLRGKIVPVIDLNLLFGHARERYHISDRVIVLDLSPHLTGGCEGVSDIRTTHDERLLFGIIVNDVLDVKIIPEEDIEPLSSIVGTLQTAPGIPRFISGEAKVDEDIIMMLDHNNLVGIFEFGVGSEENPPVSPFIKGGEGGFETGGSAPPPAFAEISPQDRAIFHERALRYIQAMEEEGFAGLMPVAVVRLGVEYFGVQLELVREFTDMHDVVPIPCCPEHIIGNMNLRGDILTLVDIRGVLNLPAFDKSSLEGKVLVTRMGELFLGVPVDEVLAVRYINQSEITEVPSAIETKDEEFIKGTAPYGGKMMTILNLSKILTREDLVVNEEA